MAVALLLALTPMGVQLPDDCPVGFSVSMGSGNGRRGDVLSTLPPCAPAGTNDRRGDVLSTLPPCAPESNETNSTCMCELFDKDTTPFLDVSHTYCGNIPGNWNGSYHFSCPHCMEQGSVLNITCPNNWEACDIIVNLHVCPGCTSAAGQAWHGNWPASLATDGWLSAGKCVPSFCSDEGQHKFVGFHKQINGGDTEVLPEMDTDPTMYFSIIVKEASPCSSITSEVECDEALSCTWDSMTTARRGEQLSSLGTCVPNWCPTTPGGQSPGCGACAPGLPGGQCQSTDSPTAATPPAP